MVFFLKKSSYNTYIKLIFCKKNNKEYVKINGKKFISFIKKNEKIIKKEKSKNLINTYRLSANEFKLFTDE